MQRPPEDMLATARQQAADAGRAVYLFHDGAGWRLTRRLGEIPGGAESFEIPPDPAHPEQANTGGC